MISGHKINVARSAAVHTTHLRLATRFAGQTVVAITHAGFVVASILAAFDIPRPGMGARLEPMYTSLTECACLLRHGHSHGTTTPAIYSTMGEGTDQSLLFLAS